MKFKKINVLIHAPESLDQVTIKINDFRIEYLEKKISKEKRYADYIKKGLEQELSE